ncbi:MAG: sulfurtransferase TusA family protein [Candidatus Coatesbacteria bacterium]|nr:MAG: sulfurtransferase TusA family protein [Candidatus Coatesbacteria bacterium]
MNDVTIVDARGLSCPAPAVAAKKAMKTQGSGRIEVLVDSGTAQDNVTRLAEGAGWKVTAEDLGGGGCKLTLEK